jgi:signal transduction histidine kinase
LLYSSDPEFGAREVSAFDSVMNIFGPPPESTEGHRVWLTDKSTDLKGEDWHSFSSPVWFPVIRHTAEDGPWMLVLQHRNGPIEASITNVWRGNLITGGIVLLLLATSVVVIVSQHAQALATLQMDFVASISHELRTPLAAILSAGQNITDGFVPSLPHYGSLITAQARQLIDLVDQILLFGSMKEGRKGYYLQPLQVREVLEDVRRNTLATFQSSGFTVEWQVPEALPWVLGDPKALSRCLQNLIGNAAKYSGKSRWIGVCAEVYEATHRDKEIRIKVKDRGLGISPSELDRIFEPFYRSPNVLAAQIHGTGLGLSVARHIAEAMGGRVSVTSEVGVGSVFILHLRIAEEAYPNSFGVMSDARPSG